MFFPSLALLATSLLTLAHAANPHHNPPARRAHHFGNPNTPLNARQDPPVGTKVYTTKIERSGNVTTTEEEAGDYVKRGSGVVDLGERGLPIGKRAFSGMRATYYAIGMGACGQYDAEPAYIVALNSAQYGGGYPGPECFKSITITGGSRNGHAVATIKDECPTCPYGGLDMSEALFSNFASADEGVATITWWYNDDAPAAPAPAPTTSSTPAYTPPAPTTSSTPAWTPEPSTSTTPAYTPPTSTWVAPTTSSSVYTPPPTSTTPTSTWVAPTTSSTPTSSSTSVWSSSIVSSSTFSSSAVVSSTIASSSSVIPTSRSSIAVGKSETASTTLSASSSSAALPTGSAKAAPAAPVQTSAGNLQLLSEVTLQLGNMIVLSAQQV